jgi:cytochrome b561
MRHHHLLLALLWFLLNFHSAYADRFILSPEKSRIVFSGTHADEPFRGVFTQWEGRVQFDPTHLVDAHISIIIKAGSADTGDAMYDRTLLTADWLDADHHPEITFVSKRITLSESGLYHAEGLLSLKGKTHPIAFDFSIADFASPQIRGYATFSIDRTQWNIGMASDPDAEWVSRAIEININVQAIRDE